METSTPIKNSFLCITTILIVNKKSCCCLRPLLGSPAYYSKWTYSNHEKNGDYYEAKAKKPRPEVSSLRSFHNYPQIHRKNPLLETPL